MEYFVISAKFVPLKYYTLSSQLRRVTSFSVGCSGRRILSPGQRPKFYGRGMSGILFFICCQLWAVNKWNLPFTPFLQIIPFSREFKLRTCLSFALFATQPPSHLHAWPSNWWPQPYRCRVVLTTLFCLKKKNKQINKLRETNKNEKKKKKIRLPLSNSLVHTYISNIESPVIIMFAI